MISQYHSLSDHEFERELQIRCDHSGQITLGPEMSKELLERVKSWLEIIDRTAWSNRIRR